MAGQSLVRVVQEFPQLKGALLLLAGNSAYFYNEEWIQPLEKVLGRKMPFAELVSALRNALDKAENPLFRSVKPEEWARRISIPTEAS